MKTSELTGHALRWAVAKCEGCIGWNEAEHGPYSPHTDWAQAGPIIERECIDLYCDHAGVSWRARKMLGERGPMSYGPTPLIAAMRCYVASKFGGEVEIPEELQP